MVNEEQVRGSLNAVLVPGAMRNIVGLNLIRKVLVSDNKVQTALASTGLVIGVQGWIKNRVKDALEKLPQVNDIEDVWYNNPPQR